VRHGGAYLHRFRGPSAAGTPRPVVFTFSRVLFCLWCVSFNVLDHQRCIRSSSAKLFADSPRPARVTFGDLASFLCLFVWLFASNRVRRQTTLLFLIFVCIRALMYPILVPTHAICPLNRPQERPNLLVFLMRVVFFGFSLVLPAAYYHLDRFCVVSSLGSVPIFLLCDFFAVYG